MPDTADLIGYEQLLDATWSRLSAAASDRGHPMRLCTVATVDQSLEPDARLLVLRGASRELGRLWFHTDRRARKVLQVRERPASCVVLYDPRDGVQLRIWGDAAVLTEGTVADQHWAQIDLALRIGYRSARPPGTPAPHRDPRSERLLETMEAQGELAEREHFAVLEVAVERIEWLQVSASTERRAILCAEEDWEVMPIVP